LVEELEMMVVNEPLQAQRTQREEGREGEENVRSCG
jgi:hypothetical protein